MRGVWLRPAARRDLAAIWNYTAKEWGAQQADADTQTIYRGIAKLVAFPERHPHHGSRHGEFRKASSGRHLVFYQVGETMIEVVRILHDSSDFDGWLAG